MKKTGKYDWSNSEICSRQSRYSDHFLETFGQNSTELVQIQEQLNSVYKTHIFMYDISITYSYFTKLGNCPRKRRHLSHKTTSLCCNIYFLVTTYRRHTVITAIIMVMVNFLSSFPQSSQGVHYNTCIPFSLG